jgi:plasmid stabilization system protein ParE
MSGAYRLTPKAVDGFRRIALYARDRFGSAVAERVVDELERAFAQLAEQAAIGHRREDLTAHAHVRFWSVGPTLVAYRRKPEWIEVLFVERADIDWESLLKRQLEE